MPAFICGSRGGCVPTKDIWSSFDGNLRTWMIHGLIEHLTDRWGGTHEGLKAIRNAHPDIWSRSEEAKRAWRGGGAARLAADVFDR